MGIYLNRGNENFKRQINSKNYVDKSFIINETNKRINTKDKFIMVSRPTRYGKTWVANLLSAYYSKGCDSSELFINLKIAKEESYLANLNKFNVIHLDIIGFECERCYCKYDFNKHYFSWLQREFTEEFPNTDFSSCKNISMLVDKAYKDTKQQFIFIIDEYDCLFREHNVEKKAVGTYIKFLNETFNSEVSEAIALAYFTGIAPIPEGNIDKSNFVESTIINSNGFGKYIGFTEDEVKELCNKYNHCFDKVKAWYDGTLFDGTIMYNSNSIHSFIADYKYCGYKPYCSEFRTNDTIIDYLNLNPNAKDFIIDLVIGKEVKVNSDIKIIHNPFEVTTKEEKLSYLVYFGYLIYDSKTKMCKIPNYELLLDWIDALCRVNKYNEMYEMYRKSKYLIEYTLTKKEDIINLMFNDAYKVIYNNRKLKTTNEIITLILNVYYSDKTSYKFVTNYKIGNCVFDLAFLPYDKSKKIMVFKLDMTESIETSVKQLLDADYQNIIEEYSDNLILIGILYNTVLKKFDCKFEECKKSE